LAQLSFQGQTSNLPSFQHNLRTFLVTFFFAVLAFFCVFASLAGFVSVFVDAIFPSRGAGISGASMVEVVASTSVGAIGVIASAGACSGFVIETSVVAGVVAVVSANVASCTCGDTGGDAAGEIATGISGGSVFPCAAETVGGEEILGKEAEDEGGAKDDGCGGNGHSQNGVGKGIPGGTAGLGMAVGCAQSCGCKVDGLSVQNRICGHAVG